MEALLTAYPNLPIWAVIVLLALNLFKQPIASALFEKFPRMADSHFSSLAADKIDKREYEQKREASLLKDQLATSEAAREQAALRENSFIEIINRTIDFSQQVVLKRVEENEENLSRQITEQVNILKLSIDRLTKQLSGKNKTQDILLSHIEGEIKK